VFLLPTVTVVTHLKKGVTLKHGPVIYGKNEESLLDEATKNTPGRLWAQQYWR